MKRIIAGILVLSAFLCACASTSAPDPLPQQTAESPTPTLAATAPPAATPVPTALQQMRQYGEARTLFADGNGLAGAILYPEGGVQPLNRAVSDWAGATLYALETKAKNLSADENGMRLYVDVDYDAYQYANRFVGVQFTGISREAVSGETETILYVYNYDLFNNREPALSDVIEQTQMEAVCALAAERLAWFGTTATTQDGALTAADMQRFVIRNDGVAWLLAGGGDPTSILLDYDTLAPYLCMETPKPTAITGETAPAYAVTEQQATCLFDGVQLRAFPSRTEGGTLTIVNTGDTLDVLDSHAVKGWCKVRYGEQIAYIPAQLVQLADAAPAFIGGFVDSAYLHVRARADTNSELLGTMVFQEPIRLVDGNAVDGWYRIWFEGKIAYAAAQYISTDRYPPETQKPSIDAAPETMYEEPRIVRSATIMIDRVGTCVTDGVVIRSAPSTRATSYGSLTGNEQVYVLEAACIPGWDRVFVYTAWNSGYIGYVQADFVRCGAEIVP